MKNKIIGIPPKKEDQKIVVQKKFVLPDLTTTFSQEDYFDIIGDTLRLAIIKNQSYQKENISGLGEKGVFVHIWDCVSRLRSIIWEGREELPDEKIRDIILDLINFCIFLDLVRQDKW